MRACQVCAAKSWGPASHMQVLQATQHTALSVDPDQCLRCDNCGGVALKSVIEETLAPVPAGGPDMFPSTALNSAMHLLSTIPKPETRTERLLRHVITGSALDDFDTDRNSAVQLVRFVRELEDALDRPERPAIEISWFQVDGMTSTQFANRGEFIEWLIHGLGYAKTETGLEGNPDDVNINRLAVHLVRWLEKGAPTE